MHIGTRESAWCRKQGEEEIHLLKKAAGLQQSWLKQCFVCVSEEE